MIRNELILDLNREIFVDNFAGGGGASSGIERALGRHVDHAINHDWAALGMHRINHPQTVHHCEDVFDIDPRAVAVGRPVGAGWFSPDCKHFSKAKGGKPLSKKIRGLAFVILRWAKIRTRVIYMENVEEIQTWGPLMHHPKHAADCACMNPCGKADPEEKGRTWKAFCAALSTGLAPEHPDIPEMLEVLNGARNGKIERVTKEELVRGFGYALETRELRACDYGAPTIRKRLFMIARCDGLPIVWPERSHEDPKKRVAGGKKLKPWKIIADCIDWSIPCNSIFLSPTQAKAVRCRRPLKPATERRIACGIDRYVLKAQKPFLISLTHQGGERVESVDEPAKTLTGANRGEKAVVEVESAPFISEHANASNDRNMPADEPMRTLCAQVKGGHFSVVSGTLAHTAHGEQDKNGNRRRGRGAHGFDEPMPSVVASPDGAVVAAHLTKFTTGAIGEELTKPAPTIVAGSHSPETHGGAASTLGLVSATVIGAGGPAYQGKPRPADSPLHTLTTENHAALAAASLVKLRGDAETHAPGSPVSEPGHTVSAGGTHHGLNVAYLAQHNGGFNTTPGHAASEPISTISGKGSQQQVVAGTLAAYYGNDAEGQCVSEPLRTVTTKERFGFVKAELAEEARHLTQPSPRSSGGEGAGMTGEQIAGARRVAAFLRQYGVEFEGEFATVAGFVIVDIGMRMLTPRELFRAQGFPEEYVIDRAWVVDPQTGEIKELRLTKEQQIRMCGNSVSPPVAEALVRANSPELCVYRRSERKQRGLQAMAA